MHPKLTNKIELALCYMTCCFCVLRNENDLKTLYPCENVSISASYALKILLIGNSL